MFSSASYAVLVAARSPSLSAFRCVLLKISSFSNTSGSVCPMTRFAHYLALLALVSWFCSC